MICFEQVSIRYPRSVEPVLSGVDLEIGEGELALVVGPTGSGKSTLLKAVTGLVPHFTGGTLAGRVRVDGRDTRTCRPRDLADVVGYVGQDPLAGFVTDAVEDELAYGMESLGIAPAVMRKRVEETLDLLGLAELRGRPLSTLSAGQQQRVAIGSVLTAHPKVLVLDEPTSALDPLAAEEVLAALQRLVHDLGLTVLLAEHRLERVVQYADRVIYVPGAGAPVLSGPPAAVMAHSAIAPPVVDLGRLAGWSPLPLSVRDARRAAATLRGRLNHSAAPAGSSAGTVSGPPVAQVRDLVVSYAGVPALRGVDLDVATGEIVALMGRNGAGKSTLLKSLVGLVRPTAGRVHVGEAVPAETPAPRMIQLAGLVPQDPADLLYAESVSEECAAADAAGQAPAGTCQELLAELSPGIPHDRHPRDLSEGQRLTVALAIILTAGPRLILLDEPTRGLDYGAKRRLVATLRRLAADDHGVLVATHDVELVAEVASRVVVLADGEVVADGSTSAVLVASPAFAPQVAKIMAPGHWLTVSQVSTALARAS